MDYVHPEDVDRTLAASRQLAENKALFNFANRYRCRDGSYRWLEWQSVLSHNLIYATARDITDRKRVEAELQAKTDEIQQAYQDLKAAQLQLIQSEKMSSLGQLVAGIAHEINNPRQLYLRQLEYGIQLCPRSQNGAGLISKPLC
jgi:C4-dicarboxylate-specific signal transduction histidine kinase